MEHIKNIEIKNFKSIRHAEIKDCRRVNVFIGYPNVGKSNILESLSLFGLLGNFNNRPIGLNSFVRLNKLNQVFFDGIISEEVSVDINEDLNLTVSGNQKLALKFTCFKKPSAVPSADVSKWGTQEKIFLKKVQFKDAQSSEEVTEGSIMDLVNNELYPVKKYIFKNQVSSFIPSQLPGALYYPFGENLSEVVRHNNILRKVCGELLGEYNLKLVFDERDNMFIQKQLDEFSAFQISFSQIADTLQRLIFHKAAIATNKNSILLFEEPESHMFPPYISKLTSDLVSDENSNQYFIATHSPYVFNNLISDLDDTELAIYLVSYKKDTGETVIDKMSKEEMHEAYQFGYDFFMNLENFIPQA